MRSIKESYDLPKRLPVPMRVWLMPLIILLASVGGWLVLPRTPVTAGLLVLVIIVVVGASVFRIMTSRQLTALPRRNPVKPPSTGGD